MSNLLEFNLNTFSSEHYVEETLVLESSTQMHEFIRKMKMYLSDPHRYTIEYTVSRFNWSILVHDRLMDEHRLMNQPLISTAHWIAPLSLDEKWFRA